MSITPKRIGMGVAPTTKTVIYTVPADTKTVIKGVTFCNSGTANRNIYLWFNDIKIIVGVGLNPKETLTKSFADQILESGTMVSLQTNAAGLEY